MELRHFEVGRLMRSAGSFRTKLGGARCTDRDGCRLFVLCPCRTTRRPGRAGAGARGGRPCRVDEHFSHFFFILRDSFLKGFVIIAPMIMLRNR